jgi:hypothetical protein
MAEGEFCIMGTALKVQKIYDPEPYNYENLNEDAAWLFLAPKPWAVTPQLLFATKDYIRYVRDLAEATSRGTHADSPEEQNGYDCGY